MKPTVKLAPLKAVMKGCNSTRGNVVRDCLFPAFKLHSWIVFCKVESKPKGD